MLVLVLGAAEGLVRYRAHLKYGDYLDIYDIYEPHPEVDLLVPRPNLSIRFANRSQIDIDSRGFRNPEVEHPKPPATVRLAFLGGSTTFCGQASSNEATWPHRLTTLLRERLPDLAFDYLNAGVTGNGVAQSILSLEHRLAPLEPDVIVVYHAAKDLAADTWDLALERGLVEQPAESRLEEWSLLWMLIRKNQWAFASDRAGRSDERKLEVDPRALSRGFRSRLETLVRDAQAVADVVVLVTFATKVRADQPLEVQLENLRQAFTFTPYLTPASVLEHYAEYNRVIEEVARETGAVLVADADAIPGDAEHFSDSVHFTERGYEAMARRVLEPLLSAPDFRALIERARAAGSGAAEAHAR